MRLTHLAPRQWGHAVIQIKPLAWSCQFTSSGHTLGTSSTVADEYSGPNLLTDHKHNVHIQSSFLLSYWVKNQHNHHKDSSIYQDILCVELGGVTGFIFFLFIHFLLLAVHASIRASACTYSAKCLVITGNVQLVRIISQVFTDKAGGCWPDLGSAQGFFLEGSCFFCFFLRRGQLACRQHLTMPLDVM